MSTEEQERRFQEALKDWRETGSAVSYKEMWIRVSEACKALSSKILKVRIDDNLFHDRCMAAVVKSMSLIVNKGTDPMKLSSFCYYPCLESFCGVKAKREDNMLSYEQSLENGYDIAGEYYEQ